MVRHTPAAGAAAGIVRHCDSDRAAARGTTHLGAHDNNPVNSAGRRFSCRHARCRKVDRFGISNRKPAITHRQRPCPVYTTGATTRQNAKTLVGQGFLKAQLLLTERVGLFRWDIAMLLINAYFRRSSLFHKGLWISDKCLWVAQICDTRP